RRHATATRVTFPACSSSWHACSRVGDKSVMGSHEDTSARRNCKMLLLASVASCLFIATACRAAPPARALLESGSLRGWNVLLVPSATWRAHRVGAYGSPLGLTPTLDRLAREGVRFADAYAHVPLTLPSHATIL